MKKISPFLLFIFLIACANPVTAEPSATFTPVPSSIFTQIPSTPT